MKKRKITVLSATVLLAIVAFPLLSTAATEAPVRSIESFVLGTSGLQMNLQLAPDGSIVPGGATVGPAYVTPPPLTTDCPPDPYCYDGGGLLYPSEPGNWYCPVGPPPESCAIPNAGEMVRWDCDNGEGTWCWWQKFSDSDGWRWSDCTESFSPEPISCSPPPPIDGPIPLAAAVAAPASFETLPIFDIRGSLVCTDCIPVTNGYECDPANCKTREFVERNIMEEYEGSCTYKYTTTTGQTVTKTITGRPPSCP